jgi:integrase
VQQTLRIYRRHTKACIHGHSEPLYDGDRSQPDCVCVLNVVGYLKNEIGTNGKPRRIRHHSLDTTDWGEARSKRDERLTWGQLTPPASGIEALGKNVTVEDAVKFFFECGAAELTKGRNTTVKYRQLLTSRLVPWCSQNEIRLVKRFDDAITVRTFFNSWRKRKNVDNRRVLEDAKKMLAPRTKAAMLERYRSFLTFCKDNGWIERNHAKKIKVSTTDVEPKYAWTMDEYAHIVKTFETWADEYGRRGQLEAIRQYAFFLSCRYTGQRISDVTTFGPDNLTEENGKWFMSLTQIKTGNFVKIPVPVTLVQRLQALPLRGELEQPFTLTTSRRKIRYGKRFWFWSGQTGNAVKVTITDETGETSVRNTAKEWGEHIAAVVKAAEKTFGRKFEHPSSAHTARHFFAITMLTAGVPIEQVAKWLGHSSPMITARHYSHANADWHRQSHSLYMRALDAIEGTPKETSQSKKRKVVTIKRAG